VERLTTLKLGDIRARARRFSKLTSFTL